ncbi:c-type cytochrome [Alteraurantiacibacter aquimixticola]|uniref:Cytochrome c n=1 Tax=Alteraurantiacibacter aquimixticola TaxID=2489173 RepID=A0A4T3F470_9SPHN|nr:cytochrome c [Alteraurantiacibacter aquimixticola]TIX51571.1 cytochrome c [Alteraurantiacibacter aquimixticola]
MAGNKGIAGKWFKTGVATLGAAALAFPLVSAVATPVDPTQAPVEEVAEAALTAEQADEARGLFSSWSCGVCHAMADANGTGHIGPSFDGNDAMDKDFIVARITNGQGAMPAFGGQITDEEIDLLAAYIMEAKK